MLCPGTFAATRWYKLRFTASGHQSSYTVRW